MEAGHNRQLFDSQSLGRLLNKYTHHKRGEPNADPKPKLYCMLAAIQEKAKVVPDLVATTFAAADLTLTAKVFWSRKPERDEQKQIPQSLVLTEILKFSDISCIPETKNHEKWSTFKPSTHISTYYIVVKN